MYNLTAKVRIFLDFSKNHPKIAFYSLRISVIEIRKSEIGLRSGMYRIISSEDENPATTFGIMTIRRVHGVGFIVCT